MATLPTRPARPPRPILTFLPRSPLTGRSDLRPHDRPPMPPTRPAARTRALLTLAVLLAVWIRLVGIPNDTWGVALWLWLVTIAWNVDAPRERHLDFVRDWWRPMLLLAVYWFLRGVADQTGMPVHVTAPLRIDEWLGGGTTPTELLQHDLCGDPCDRSGPPRWYDFLLTTVYASHFLTALTIAAVLWLRDRGEWLKWMRRFVAIDFVGLTIYFVYPVAPPWMAADLGVIGEVHRMSGRGWSELGLHRQNMVLLGMSNKVAAMPSLHAGIAFLVAFYAVHRLRSQLRWLLLLYPLAMSTALVYFGEHYVIDAVAGALAALLVVVGCSALERWSQRDVSPPPSGS
jgi:membrane-associated phospholipid phosphatase